MKNIKIEAVTPCIESSYLNDLSMSVFALHKVGCDVTLVAIPEVAKPKSGGDWASIQFSPEKLSRKRS